MRTLRLILWVTLGGAVVGCGQKGPLVLPDAQRPHKQIGIPRPPAPAAKPAATPAIPAPSPAGPGAPSVPLPQPAAPAPATPNGS